MNTLEQLQAWVALDESETLEFKSTTGERREGTRSVCAMLNNRGGRVLYGVAPDSTVIGLATPSGHGRRARWRRL